MCWSKKYLSQLRVCGSLSTGLAGRERVQVLLHKYAFGIPYSPPLPQYFCPGGLFCPLLLRKEGRPRHLFGGQDSITEPLSKQNVRLASLYLNFKENRFNMDLISRYSKYVFILNSLVTLSQRKGQTRKIFSWKGKQSFNVNQLKLLKNP